MKTNTGGKPTANGTKIGQVVKTEAAGANGSKYQVYYQWDGSKWNSISKSKYLESTPSGNFVPRWRTMMLPALMVSPPKRLTPSRLASESRPFLVEPPPFFCAIDSISLNLAAVWTNQRLNGNFGVVLAMPLGFGVVLAPTMLKDSNFVTAAMRDHPGFHACAFKQGPPNIKLGAVAKG